MNKLIPKLVGTSLNLYSHISAKQASEKAMTIFATPRKGRLSEKQKTFLSSADQLTLYYNDLPIQTYSWKGHKKTILLAHGWESNAARWKTLIQPLINEGFHIVALDAPAHGASGSTTFNAVLYSEFINSVVNHFQPQLIVGHSVGAMATAFFQHKYQYTSLEKLVLLGSPSNFTDIFKRYVTMLGYNTKIENGLNSIVYKRFGKHPDYFSVSEFVKHIPQKGLLIHDTEDEIIPYKDATHIVANYENAELVTTQGYGHGLKHRDIINTVVKFINQ